MITAALAVTAGAGGHSAGSPARIPQPTHGQLVAAGLDKLPLGPLRKRVDLRAPRFTHPTRITNPLFPISRLRSVVFSGRVDGRPFHTETTLLPQTRIIEWSPGHRVQARISQYLAYAGGRIEEVALDYYAQADDGAVWYLGEEVQDYNRGGLVDSTDGTWLAGRDGPPEMIMPAHPKPGDVHRAENIPAVAFEEVEIKQVGKTVAGPSGPIDGAMVASELHDDGTYSDKVFAPGYGEFFTSDKGELEALALAVPADRLHAPVPPALRAVRHGADAAFAAADARRWTRAATVEQGLERSWAQYATGPVPPRLAREARRALNRLRAAIHMRARAQAASAAIDVAQSATDLELRHRPPTHVDRVRFSLWARQARVDATARDLGALRGDTATLEWIRDRFAHTISPADRTAIDAHLVVLRDAVANGNRAFATARAQARMLTRPLRLGPVSARD